MGGVAIETASLSVGNAAAVELSSAGQAYGTGPSRLVVKAPAETLFVGPAGVTAGTGYPVAANAELALDLAPGEQLFGIIAGGVAQTVKVLRAGV